jgi:hypothetical protein
VPRALLLAATLALVVPAPAAATQPASTYNADGEAHADRCVRPAGTIPLRYANGEPTGFTVSGSAAYTDGSCPDGTIRLDLHEIVDSPLGPLAFERGGNGYVDAQNAKYGQVALSDLADPVGDPVPSGGGRGAPCPLVAGSRYEATIASIPAAMHYKRPQDVPSGNNSGASFLHYGDPGADQGDRHDVHYSYLLWSFLNARGGGHVRTLLHEGQVVQPCDVDPILMDAFDSAGDVDGTVLARYIRTDDGGTPLYGWMVWEHDAQDGNGAVAHARPLDGPEVTTPPALAVSPPVSRPPAPPPAPAPVALPAAAPPPPPPTPPPPPPPPLPMRAVADLAKTALDKRGRVRLPIACTGTAASACTGTLRLDAVLPRKRPAAAARSVRFSTLARRGFAVAAGRSAVVTLRVASRLRLRLPRGRGVRARVVLGAAAQSFLLVRR